MTAPALSPELKAVVDDVANGVKGIKTAQAELIEKLAELDQRDTARLDKIAAAQKQLEEEHAKLRSDHTRQMRHFGRDMNAAGRYRGVFDREDDARAFGLLVMARTGENREHAAAVLKSEFADIYQRAMASSPDSAGGALLVPEFSTRLTRLVEEYGVFERNAFKVPMTGESQQWMRQTGELTVYDGTEGVAPTESQLTFGNVSLGAREWIALTFYPETLSADAAVAVGEIVMRSMAYAFALKMDTVGFNGDGSVNHHRVMGIRTRLAAINGVDDGGGLVLGAGNAYSELTLPNFDALVGALPQYAAGRAKLYCSRKFFFEVLVRLSLSSGGVTAAEIEGQRRMMFMGVPVEISQVMPTTAANSQICCLLGDLQLSTTIGDRQAYTVKQSREYKWAERQVGVMGIRRVGVLNSELGTATAAGPVVGLITAAA